MGLCRVGEVKVDRPHVFPSSVIPFALGLYDVTAWHGSLFDDGTGDVFIFDQRPEEHFLPWA